jgi:UDP-N-acetylglucosamine--N-acetylmuramyl-(pentapeptide) pyrophosphoryl-undecaprenol N-acetylglucosamine transferase
MAALRGVPTLLMEQNATPGLTNRLLSRIVRTAAVTYEDSLATFGGKAFVAGNPVRAEFFAPSGVAPAAGGRTRVLVFGGSQGAHAINVAMAEAAPALAAAAPGVDVTHQTGERDLAMVREAYAAAGLAARVEPFLYEMDREMRAADVIVCRAGATTLAELTAAGRAAILIPLPTATDDHQRKNADALVRQGAARMVDQKELTGARLAEELLTLARDGGARERMAAAARAMARPDAARVIVDKVLELAG